MLDHVQRTAELRKQVWLLVTRNVSQLWGQMQPAAAW